MIEYDSVFLCMKKEVGGDEDAGIIPSGGR